jgi:secreted trypsin-like serine protease
VAVLVARSHRHHFVVFAFALVALLPTSALAVFGGKNVSDSDPVAHAVAAVRYADKTGIHLCTAVVLAPRLVLTAAHCTAGDRTEMRVIFTTQLVYIGDDQLRMVAGVAKAAATPAGKGQPAYQNPDDLALVLLDKPAPPGVVTMALPKTLPSARTVRTVGYGAISDLRKGKNGGKQIGFDQVLRATSVPVATATQNLITTDQTKGTGICTGDSGGPAYVSGPDKGYTVVGIMIGVASPLANPDYCRGSAYFVSLPRWTSWIKSTAANFKQPL